jgi:hypothetical protein
MNKHDFIRGFMCGSATLAVLECLRVGYVHHELGMGTLMAAGWATAIIFAGYGACFAGRLYKKFNG